MKNMVEDDFVVHHIPKEFQPIHDRPECSDEDDVISVTLVGESFMYVIPSSDQGQLEKGWCRTML